MSATWREFMSFSLCQSKFNKLQTNHQIINSILISSFLDFQCNVSKSRWNKYTQIASRALRQALNETDRVAAERRAQIGIRFQHWENGVGGEQRYVVPPETEKKGLPPV